MGSGGKKFQKLEDYHTLYDLPNLIPDKNFDKRVISWDTSKWNDDIEFGRQRLAGTSVNMCAINYNTSSVCH
eukprot:m.252901 g.252901  ORF g.252901 m.252901 type:complete len:72 (+) comp16159_c0_seq2:1908-2123(+)